MRELLPAAYRDTATVAIHDPDARDSLGYLAVGADDEPIYLNRLLCDADVVVPIGCLRCEPAIDYHGMFGGLFPTFSGRQTQDKLFASVLTHEQREEPAAVRKFKRWAGCWACNLRCRSCQGPAAKCCACWRACQRRISPRSGRLSAGLGRAVPRAAKLVIAAIDGPASEQSWDNLARALASALRLVAADGAIALCTAITHPPGPTMKQVSEMKDRRGRCKNLRKHRVERFTTSRRAGQGASPDARLPAQPVAGVRRRGTRRDTARKRG